MVFIVPQHDCASCTHPAWLAMQRALAPGVLNCGLVCRHMFHLQCIMQWAQRSQEWCEHTCCKERIHMLGAPWGSLQMFIEYATLSTADSLGFVAAAPCASRRYASRCVFDTAAHELAGISAQSCT